MYKYNSQQQKIKMGFKSPFQNRLFWIVLLIVLVLIGILLFSSKENYEAEKSRKQKFGFQFY